MKLNYYLDPQDPVRKELESLGAEYDPSADYILSHRAMSANYLSVKKEDAVYFVDCKNIIFIESIGKDVLIHMKDGVYKSADRLKALDQMLDSASFLRVSNSCIVNLKCIRRIEASIFQKFILHLIDGSKVDVTRSYYYIFKDRLGI